MSLLKGMEAHLGVKTVHENWRGVEEPEPAQPNLASNKTVFEMVDVESVRLFSFLLSFLWKITCSFSLFRS